MEIALITHRTRTIKVTRYASAEKWDSKGIIAAVAHIKAVLIDHFSLNQIIAGISRT